jgi:SAM-dependent methyltransferase
MPEPGPDLRDAVADDGACCAPSARDRQIARYFDAKVDDRIRAAAGELPPLTEVSEELLLDLADVAEVHPTVLELGCGTGGLTLALLAQGASQATGLDLSPTSIGTAEERARAVGIDRERVTFSVGDASSAPLTAHDWVVLDRVICCHPSPERLVGQAVSAALRRVAYSVPESRGLRGLVNRVVWFVEDAWDVLLGRGCPTYVHDVRRIDRVLGRAGFAPVRERTVGMWRLAVFERSQ